MNKQIHSDNELFYQVSQGNADAFKVLFDQNYSTLVRVLMRYSRNPEQIKDWIQEIYLKLWENRVSMGMENIENTKGYFITMARNHVIKLLSKKKQIHLIFEESLAQADIADNNLLEAMAQKELFQAYHTALLKMPSCTRKAYSLNREEGMTYSRVAQELGVSVKTVEAQISRALSLLRRELITFFH